MCVVMFLEKVAIWSGFIVKGRDMFYNEQKSNQYVFPPTLQFILLNKK